MDSCSASETDNESFAVSTCVLECYIFESYASLRVIGNKVKCKGCSREVFYNVVDANKGNIGNLTKHLKTAHASHPELLKTYNTAVANIRASKKSKI